MGFSKADFDRDAKALFSAFAASKGEESVEPSFALSRWRLKGGDSDGFHYDSYLSHPPVTVSSSFEPLGATKEASAVSNSGQEPDDALEEEGIIQDDQCYVHETNTTDDDDDDDDKLQQTFVTQWNFSIVYSSTYQAPVLYFQVQEESIGNPVGRELLLKLLGHEHQRSDFQASSDFPTETWEFVSQEEHPITGISSFFLHPCQSAQRLQILLTTTTNDKIVGMEEQPKRNVLWVWMSMILPAVGHSVPSPYYTQIQNCIARQN